MGRPEGFEYERVGDTVVVYHRGRRATVLRGSRASAFLTEVESSDAQLVMARVTGKYKRGNERMARQHRRNRSR